jgi:hypothetical protein
MVIEMQVRRTLAPVNEGNGIFVHQIFQTNQLKKNAMLHYFLYST